MLPATETACFAIAEISGYSRFVSGVELDHAQDIIADIMDALVRALRPPFRLAKFEGDAAFVYAPADKVDGSLLQDSIEHANFRVPQAAAQHQAGQQLRVQSVSRYAEPRRLVRRSPRRVHPAKEIGPRGLAGRDVILVHRLLENDVVKTFGSHAYTLYSEACVRGDGDRILSRRAFARSSRRSSISG